MGYSGFIKVCLAHPKNELVTWAVIFIYIHELYMHILNLLIYRLWYIYEQSIEVIYHIYI